MDNRGVFSRFELLYEINIRNTAFETWQSPEREVHPNEPVHVLKYFALSLRKHGYSGPWVISLSRYDPNMPAAHGVEFSVVKYVAKGTEGIDKSVVNYEKVKDDEGFIHFTYFESRFFSLKEIEEDDNLTKLNALNGIYAFLKT
jgi:hypothetical protein